MKKNIFVLFLVIGIISGCASQRHASINENPKNGGEVNFDEHNISILTPSVDPDDLGTYLILKSEANRINARAEAILAETALKNAIKTNPEKYKGINLPVSSFTETNVPSENLRTVYVCNKSSQNVLGVSLTGASIKDEPGEKLAYIPYGEKNGKVFLVNDDEFIVYAYTADFQLFREPKRLYVPRKSGQAIAWNGEVYDLIVNIHNPDWNRGYNRYGYNHGYR